MRSTIIIAMIATASCYSSLPLRPFCSVWSQVAYSSSRIIAFLYHEDSCVRGREPLKCFTWRRVKLCFSGHADPGICNEPIKIEIFAR